MEKVQKPSNSEYLKQFIVENKTAFENISLSKEQQYVTSKKFTVIRWQS
jgi:hypothetical protein